MSDLEVWLSGRLPPAPEAMSSWLGQGDVEAAPLAQALVSRGRRRLNEAVRNPGRNRGAAFHLLTADALLTYACEAAATETNDVGEELRRVLRRIGDPLD